MISATIHPYDDEPSHCSVCVFYKLVLVVFRGSSVVRQKYISNSTSREVTNAECLQLFVCVIYASSSARESYIFNSTFAYNEAYEMGTIYLVESTLRLTSSQFKYNRSTTDSPGIILLGSILRCHDVDFMHQTGVSGSII